MVLGGAAELARAQRDELGHVVGVVLQVGQVEHELPAVHDRADAEHVPEGLRGLATAVVERHHLARALLAQRAADQLALPLEVVVTGMGDLQTSMTAEILRWQENPGRKHATH